MIVLDSSAVIALLFREPGHERVAPHVRGSLISTVNLIEVLTRFARDGIDPAAVSARLTALGIRPVSLDEAAALGAARLWSRGGALGLSLGDRACLALALSRQSPVLTADRAWAALPLDVPIEVIR